MLIMTIILYFAFHLLGSIVALSAYNIESALQPKDKYDIRNRLFVIIFSWVMVLIIKKISEDRKRLELIEQSILNRKREC